MPSAPALLLECRAAAAFDQLNTAFKAVFGQDIGITDGYRSYDEQVACRAEKGSLCADPGTSNHGWAKAVDIGACCGVNTGSGAAFDWLTANAGPVRLGPPAVGATRRVETRTVALGIRGDLMNWQPQSGTEAITGWINQGVLFALVLAVAAVVACAATWAVGSLAANGAVVVPGADRRRGRPGRRVAPGRRRHLRALDRHPGRGVRRRPQGLRHRGRSADAGGVGVPGPVGAVDRQHQHGPGEGRPATVDHGWWVGGAGAVVREQPRRAGRRLPPQLLVLPGGHRDGVRAPGITARGIWTS